MKGNKVSSSTSAPLIMQRTDTWSRMLKVSMMSVELSGTDDGTGAAMALQSLEWQIKRIKRD